MKTKNIFHIPAILLTVVCMTGSLFVLPVSAGKSEIVLDESTIQSEIDSSRWNDPSEQVIAQDGVLVFPSDSTEETKLITKAGVQCNDALDILVSAEANMQFVNLPKDKKFVLAFGLKTIESELGEAGNIEIAFTNDDGVKASVVAYTQEGECVELVSAKSCGAGKQANVNAVITTEGKLRLTVNEREICNVKLPESGEGRVGFLQTGSCEVKISNVNIKFYKYDNPQNCDISEDFEKGEYNKNLLTSQEVHGSYFDGPSRVCIEEYEGSQVYMVYNAGANYLGTMYKYSNFEISFDVPQLIRADQEDEDGNIVRGKSAAFGVAFGGAGTDFQTWGYTSSADMVLFNQNSSVSSMNNGYATIHPDYPFFSEDCTRGFSVKISVIDAVVTAYLKWMDETQYKEVVSYDLKGETPLGTIQIWTTGMGNFAIDNLKIVNKDKNPNLVEVDYASSVIEIPEDYQYEPMKMEYMQEEEEKSEWTFRWYMVVVIVAVVCVVSFITFVVIFRLKNKSRKDGVQHEE